MARIANKKTGKFTKRYRDPSVFHFSTRRYGSRRWGGVRKKTYSFSATKLEGGHKLGISIFGLIIVVVAIGIAHSNYNDKINDMGPVTLSVLQAEDHPMLYDLYDDVKEYYEHYHNIELRGSLDNSDEPNILYFASTHAYNYIYTIEIYFENLSETERKYLDFNEVLQISSSYVPKELGQYYDFIIAAQYDSIPNQYNPESHVYVCYYTLNELGKEENRNNGKNYENHLTFQIADQNGLYYAIINGYWGGYDDYFQKYDKAFLERVTNLQDWDWRLF